MLAILFCKQINRNILSTTCNVTKSSEIPLYEMSIFILKIKIFDYTTCDVIVKYSYYFNYNCNIFVFFQAETVFSNANDCVVLYFFHCEFATIYFKLPMKHWQETLLDNLLSIAVLIKSFSSYILKYFFP